MLPIKWEIRILGAVALGTSVSLVASMVHLYTSFGWANLAFMAWALAFVTVMLNAIFIVLASTSQSKTVRRAVIFGMVLLFITEFCGNFAAGGLIALRHLPEELTVLFLGADRMFLVWSGTLLWAAFLPILNFISVYALSEAIMRVIASSRQVITPNQWAEFVLRRQSGLQPEKEPANTVQPDSQK
jgi:hypothetical protein